MKPTKEKAPASVIGELFDHADGLAKQVAELRYLLYETRDVLEPTSYTWHACEPTRVGESRGTVTLYWVSGAGEVITATVHHGGRIEWETPDGKTHPNDNRDRRQLILAQLALFADAPRKAKAPVPPVGMIGFADLVESLDKQRLFSRAAKERAR